MDPVNVLVIVLLVAATGLCAVAAWALRELVAASRSVRSFADDTRDRLVPLLEKADVTIDAVNAEILRVDSLITQFEQAGERVTHASGTLSEIVNAPADLVTDVADRVRRAWRERKRGHAVAAGTEDAGTGEQTTSMDRNSATPAQ